LLIVSVGKTLRAMNSTANEQVLTALQQVVGAKLKSWLDENKTGANKENNACDAHPSFR
jgi:hypothetical protein